MKIKDMFCASLTLVAMVLGGVTATAATANPAVNAPAMAATNSDAAITALFGDRAIVKGKGFEIKQSELDQVLTGAKASAAAAGQMLQPDFEVKVLNRMIMIQLLLQKATDADRTTGRQQALEQLTNIMKNFPTPDAFARQLKVVGMTQDQLVDKATQEAVANNALRRELNISVSDADAKTYYDAHSADFEEPEMVHLRDILLLTVDPSTQPPTPLSPDKIDAKRKQAADLLKRLRSGEDFASLAQYSDDMNTRNKGGELPKVSRAQMGSELAAAAFSLTNNQVSDVIETTYGFYIIKLLDKTPAKKYAYNETLPQIQKTPADLCKTQLEGAKIESQAPAYVEKLKKDSDVEILDPSLKSLMAALEAAATNAPADTLPAK